MNATNRARSRFSRYIGPGVLTAVLLSTASGTHGQTDARPRISGPLPLEAAVDTTIKSNLAVEAMQFEADAASQETRATRAMTRPQLSATTYLSSGSMPNILGTPPGIGPASTLTVPGRTFADQNLSLMVPLYTGGRLENLVKAASKRESAAMADVGTAQLDAVYLVKEIYYRALLAGEIVKASQARVDAAAALVEVTRAQFEAGKGIQASVARAMAELADAKRTRANANNDQVKLLLDLRRAMGVRLDSDITLTDALSMAPPAGDLDADLGEAERVRPELLAARARVDSAKAQTGAAKGDRKPQLYGTAMADAFAPRVGSKNIGGTIGLAMSIPLRDSGQRAAEVRRMEAIARRSEAELRELELRVATEVRQARLDVETATENYRAAQAVVESSQAAYDVVVLRVENQKSILVEQLDALATLTQARVNLVQALFDHSIAMARLQRAIGRR